MHTVISESRAVERAFITCIMKLFVAHEFSFAILGDTVILTENEFCWALKDFKPSALRDISLMAPGSLGWADIGGLLDVRKMLERTLLWPFKAGIR